jgi:hypothetical protein
MVDLLEIPLLPQLIIGGSRFLGGNASLIQVLLQHGQLIGEGSIGTVDLGDLRQFGEV